MEIKDIDNIPVWKYFQEILTIPRPSKKEEKIIDYLLKFGQEHGLETLTDEVGNVLIRKPAIPGYEHRIPVVLQSHIDMVCAKETDMSFDFAKDPVPAYVEGNWVKSHGTTLGADDGIGVAAALAILDSITVKHGPVECLFTVDEESGMTGARGLRKDWLKGRILINLDSEDEGELFIGCAGGLDTTAVFNIFFEPVPENTVSFRIRINGLTGGHSGDEIHKGHANAIKLVNRFLWKATQDLEIRLNRFEGGTFRNAIPTEAEAVFVIHERNAEKLKYMFKEFVETVKSEYRHTDPGMKFQLEQTVKPGEVMPEDRQKQFLLSIYGCWHGVYSWSKTIPGLVETSTNLALIKFETNHIEVGTNQRSSVESGIADVAETVASVFRLADASVTYSDGYPGWTPNPDSLILKITKDVYRKLFNQEPAVKAIHAGLECGLFRGKYPEMDMISFGPTIRGAHTPREKLDIASTRKFWELLVEVLARIPE